MSHRNPFFAALALGALLFATRLPASEPPSNSTTPATNRPVFSASLRAGETVGDRQIQRAFLTIGTNELAFVIPAGFRMDASNPEKIVLTDNGGTYFLTVRVSTQPYPDAASAPDFFKARALNRFPAAKISSESSEFAANHSGPAFNLDWLSPNGVAQSARIAFVFSPAGILEFSVLSRTSDFKDAQTYLSLLMVSVRSNETGKLVIIPDPDFT
jgi:hypothetical protein